MDKFKVSNLLIIAFWEICVIEKYVLSSESREVRVSTYNLWNIMFNWDIRKLRIAQMVKELDPDILVLQEVRFNEDEKHSQLDELKQYLPQYKYTFSGVGNTVSQKTNRVWKGWEKEGLGLMSKMKILNTEVYVIPHHGGPDTNKRIMLHAEIQIDVHFIVNVLAVHFSYDRTQQCHNAFEVFRYITRRKLQNVIVIGDMNTYVNFEWPSKMMTDHHIRHNQCLQYLRSEGQSLFVDVAIRRPLKDVTVITEKRTTNFTFSNMPIPGLESRPDRILVSTSFRCLETQTSGNGIYYKQKYYGSILIHRFMSVLHSAYNSYLEKSGFSCLHDCGPRGSCRCGICVGGGETNTCLLPECEECKSQTFKDAIFLTFIFFLLTFQLVYTLVKILVTSSYFSPKNLYDYLGCTCCLCNPKLYRQTRVKMRRKWWQKILIICPQNYIPSMVLLFILLLLYSIFFLYVHHTFKMVLPIVTNTMDEEFYPSDHLMLSANLILTI